MLDSICQQNGKSASYIRPSVIGPCRGMFMDTKDIL